MKGLPTIRAPLRQRLKESRAGYLFLLPWLIGIVTLTLGPMVMSLLYSFTNFGLFSAPQWIGFSNYVELFSDPRYLASLRVTFTYVLVSVPLEMAFALAVAVLLNRGLAGLAVYRALYYVPSLLGGSVAIALLWQRLFATDGLVNQLLGYLGVPGRGWISEPDTALGTLVILRVWQFGAPMVIFLAGLRQIPEEVLEAAAVDGAGRWRRFWQITMPLLSPVVFFNLVLQIIGAFQAFTPAYIISNGKGGPTDSTLFYTLYLYQQAFGNFRMGYGSAMAWVLLAIIGAFTFLNFVVGRSWVYYEDESRVK